MYSMVVKICCLTAMALAGKAMSHNIPRHHVISKRIVGGKVAKPSSYPWQVMVEIFENFECGGTIIDKDWVLTAAHCIDNNGSLYHAAAVKVIVGNYDQNIKDKYEQSYSVERIIKHEDYKTVKGGHDIALLKLTSSIVNNSRVKAIQLPETEVQDGTTCVATGWGHTISRHDPGNNRLLHEVEVPIRHHTTCREWYINQVQITDNMLCAGYREGGRDPCKLDSGGPLVCNATDRGYRLYGIISFGEGCGDFQRPGIYTSVFHYNKWIKKHLKDSPVEDPCNEYKLLSDNNGNLAPSSQYGSSGRRFGSYWWYRRLPRSGWVRLTSATGQDGLTKKCVQRNRCGTRYPIWQQGDIPNDGKVHTMKLFMTFFPEDCSRSQIPLRGKHQAYAKGCGDYTVYKLPVPPQKSGYCIGQ